MVDAKRARDLYIISDFKFLEQNLYYDISEINIIFVATTAKVIK